MTSQITAADIAGWDSLDDIASTLQKRGLEPQSHLGDDNTVVLKLAENEFIELVRARPGESLTDHHPKDAYRRHTNLVATSDFEEFTFVTRVRTFDQSHGQIKHQKLSFTKSQFKKDSGEKHSILEKLNAIEYGEPATIYDYLYDTKKIVKEFYEQFEELRTDLVQEVRGIPDDRGDAKQQYVQVLLDRMIFLYFIQAKRLLDRNPNYLHEHHETVVEEGGDVYQDFYTPLFFDLLAEGGQDPDFGSLPYLNGGLFTKNQVEIDYPEARLGNATDDTNELFSRILDFLSDWNWNVDERLDIVDPKNLSPAVLGHIFEQTVNQKEMGAYYTPEEITGFMARRSMHPYLLDQLNEAVDAEYEEIDEVFDLVEPSGEVKAEEAIADGGTFTQQAPTSGVQTDHVETLYFDILQETRVLDPAVGSGAFLLAAQEVLLDVHLQCLEFFEEVEAEGRSWELQDRTRDLLEQLQRRKGTNKLHAKREIILNNLYGVDIDDGAVEICKLRLWLSMVADIEDEPSEVEPLPNIDFNIRQGNSLIGFTGIQEVATDDGDAALMNYGGGIGPSVKDLYEDVISAIENHQQATSAVEATNARKIADSQIQNHSAELNKKVLDEFHKAGVEEITLGELEESHVFHWVLEFAPVYADGGFDILIGNPPWEVLTPNRDEFFSRFDETFRSYSSEQKDDLQDEYLEDSKISREWEKYKKEMQNRADYFNKSQNYKLQSPKVDGRTVASENDLSALFLERIFEIASDQSYVSLILPGFIYFGAIAKDLRRHLLDETTLDTIIGFENKGIFEQLHNQYRFGIITFANKGKTEFVRGIFEQTETDILKSIDDVAVEIPRTVLSNYSPEAGIFPLIKRQQEAEVLNKLLRQPPLGDTIEQKWNVDVLTKELHEPSDSHLFVGSESEGDYPVYSGENFYQYSYDERFFDDIAPVEYWSKDLHVPEKSAKHRIREKKFNQGYLKRELYIQFGGEETSKSQVQFVDELLEKHRGKPLSEEDVLLDCTEYRIAYRDITNSTNERTLISAVIPPDVTCLHTVQTIKPYEIKPGRTDLEEYPLHSAYKRSFSDLELFAALGLLNSIPFDFLLRTKIETHIVKYKFLESQLPRLSEGDDWFNYISSRAAKLNCYGESFADMRARLGDIEPVTDIEERRAVQAEIDAAAFHAYGLAREDTQFVLDDFHRVENPRMMDEEYFELVMNRFDTLESEGPKP